MKEYTAPQVTVIDNWEELKIEPATLEWALDVEKNQIVVTSRFETVEPEDEEDEMRYFKLRPETVEVLRVDCDPAEIEIVKEGVDEEGNKFKTIVTKKQNVAFEIGAPEGELKEWMAYGEDFSVYWGDVDSYYTVAFHKDGRWWFLELNHNNLGLMGYTYWDDEADRDVEVPFSCETIHQMSTYEPYIHGEGEYDGEYTMSGRELWVICEDGDDQYGVRFYEGCGDVEHLNQHLGDGEAWTKIELVGESITISTLEDEAGVKKQWVRNGFFNGVLALYDREAEDSEEFQYDVINGKFLRIVQGSRLNLYRLKAVYSFGMDMKDDENEVIRDIKAGLYGYLGIEIKERCDGYFVVEQEVPAGNRKKVQKRIICDDSYVGGVYDDAEFLGLAVEGHAPLFKVKKDGYWGVIDETGMVVLPLHYTKIASVKDGVTEINGQKVIYDLFLEEFGRKGWGYVTEENEFFQTIPCEYECVKMDFYGNAVKTIRVEKMGRMATYDLDGRLKDEFKPGRI